MITTLPSMTETPDVPSRSRENAVQHGFTGDGVVLPEGLRQQVEQHRIAYTQLYQPRNQDDRDLVHQAALGIVRFETLQGLAIQRAEFRAEQAVGNWHLLRVLDAQEKAKRISHDPANVVTRLKTNLGGVEWLRGEWEWLRLALESAGNWTEKQQLQAQNLAGVPRDHRHHDRYRIVGGTLDERKELVKRQIGELEALLNDPELTRLDTIERQQTLDNRGLHLDPTLDRLNLYERRAFRMYQNARQELQERLDLRESAAEALAAASDAVNPPPAPVRESRKRRINRRIALRHLERPPGIIESLQVEPCGPPLHPPFYFQYTPDEYMAKITDPEIIAMVDPSELPERDNPVWERMAAWISTNGFDLNLESTVRGLYGMITLTCRQRAATRAALAESLPDPAPAPLPHPSHPIDPQSARNDRHRHDLRHRANRKADRKRHRDRYR